MMPCPACALPVHRTGGPRCLGGRVGKDKVVIQARSGDFIRVGELVALVMRVERRNELDGRSALALLPGWTDLSGRFLAATATAAGEGIFGCRRSGLDGFRG